MCITIAVVNNSGNVGKTTICDVLFKPRLTGAEIIRVESINYDGNEEEKIAAREFNEIFKKIDVSESAIIDVGSSNVETFILQLEAYKNSQEDIDYFVIPVTPPHKQQIDSISTITNLVDLGVDTSKIKFIFNQVDKTITLEKQFSEFFNGLKIFENIKMDKTSIVYDTPVFKYLNQINKTFDEILNDNRNFKALIRQTEDRKEREKLSNEKSIKRLVTGINDELDIAFNNLDLN